MTVEMPKAGLFDARQRLTKAGHSFFAALARNANAQEASGGSSGGTSSFTGTLDEPVYVENPFDQSYTIIAGRGFAGTITGVTYNTRIGSVRVTATVGGVSVAVLDATTAVQTADLDIDFSEGAAWGFVLSLVAACRGLSVTWHYTRS